MTKKGQLTIFIVVGIVLLALVGVSLYVTNLKIEGDVSGTTADVIDEFVPDEVLPFTRFIESCTEEILFEALKKAGASGGEIYYQDFGRVFNYFDPASSDGIEMFLGGDINVPYWIYMDGDCEESCTKIYNIPALVGDEITSVQSQVERYVETNLYRCLKSADELEFQNIYYEINGFPQASVTFSDADVAVSLNYPFLIETGGESYTVSQFRASKNLPFKKYYDSAVYLGTLVDEYSLFEKATLQWISLYSYMDNDALPPMAGSDLEYVSTLLWTTSEVQNNLKNILSKNIPLFTVQSSKNYHPVKSDSFFNSTYNNYIFPGENFEDYNIDFSYLDWNPRLVLNDDDKVIRPESVNFDWFPFFGINRIRTMYTVSYPILITIENPVEVLGEGFRFSFGIEVNIKDNDLINESQGNFNYSVFENPETADSYLCDIQNSEPVSFEMIDGATGEPLGGVIMNYVCGDETCTLGKTQVNGSVNMRMPVCSGAVIQLMKPNYETIYLQLNPNIISEESFGKILLEPYRMMNISMNRHLYVKNLEGTSKYNMQFNKNDWYLESTKSELLPNEQAIIILERQPDSTKPTFIYTEDFVTFGVYGDEELKELRLLPGMYSGTIISISDFEDNPLLIKPRKKCEKILGGLSEKCFWIPEEDLSLNSYAGAGAYFNGQSPYLVFKKSDLDNNDEIVFSEIFIDIPGIPEDRRIVEDLEKMGLVEELSEDYWEYIRPEFR